MLNKKIFTNILDNFIHPRHELLDMSSLTIEDVDEMLEVAAEHFVFPIIYEGLRKTDAFLSLPAEQQKLNKTRIKKLVIGQTHRTSLFLMLYKDLLTLGIPMLVVKGVVCRNMYQNPDYRASCDEDVLVKREDFTVLDEALQLRGFTRNEKVNPKKDHEVAFYHMGTGLHIEVHLSLFPEDSGAYGRLNQEFEDIFDRYTKELICGVEVETLDPTQHMLYLLCHGLKHFLHSGFGVRQLCDMILFAETYGDRINWSEVVRSTKRQSMYTFWMNLFDIGERYLGFSWEKAGLTKPDDVVFDSEPMLQDLFDSGIYGKKGEDRVHSANITLQAARSGRKKVSLRRSLFPDCAYMALTYTYLEKHKWLLPFAWIQRIFNYMKKRNAKEAMEVVNIGKTRTELLKKYEVIDQ